MAIGISEPVAEVATTTNATSYATASFTPTANSLLLVMVFATGTLSQGSMSGQSLTWVRQYVSSSGGHTGYIFWAKVGSSPSTGALTFSCTDDGATGCFINVHQYTGYDAAARNPIRQFIEASSSTINPRVIFGTNLNTNNGYSAFWVSLTTNTSTAPTNWTETSDGSIATPTAMCSAAYRAGGETGTTIAFTSSASVLWRCVGIEVYVDGAAPKTMLSLLGAG